MRNRNAEKIGWIGGWLGGFLWLCLLSIVWLVHGKIINGLLGLGLFTVAILTVLASSPWKHAETKYWKLMLPIYAIFAISAGLCVWLVGGFGRLGLDWRTLLWLTPLLIPVASVGTRCWKDGDSQP